MSPDAGADTGARVGAWAAGSACCPEAADGSGRAAGAGVMDAGAGAAAEGTGASGVGVGSAAGGSAAGIGSGAGCGGACGGTVRGGRNESGSRYPFGSAVVRTPRWTYATGHSGSPDEPSVPTWAPSVTGAPRLIPIEPR